MKKYGIIVLIGFIVLWAGCDDLRSYPPRPDVEFKDYKVDKLISETQQVSYKVYFRLKVEDGDGDIGLHDNDTLGVHASGQPYHSNLFISLYKEKDGEFVEEPGKTPYDQRIPFIKLEGQNKTLIADVEVAYEFFPEFNTDSDTIKFRFHIVDRALNHSDTAYTCKIPFKEQTKGYRKEPPAPKLNQ